MIFFSVFRHYWEMKVNQIGWACGVAYQGVPRNSWLGSNAESWILHHNPAKLEYKVCILIRLLFLHCCILHVADYVDYKLTSLFLYIGTERLYEIWIDEAYLNILFKFSSRKLIL